MFEAAQHSQAISLRALLSVSYFDWYDDCRRRARRLLPGLLTALLCIPITAEASFLKGEAVDKAADVITWVVIIFVPLGAIALFWMVHVLPEKIAEKRHHPQQTAIKTLCLLSLVFGGMLWPLAWLWAYVKPVGYKMAYGTDKHDNYFMEIGERAEQGEVPPAMLEAVIMELDGLAARGSLTPELRAIRDRLAVLQSSAAAKAAQNKSPSGQAGGTV